MAKSRTKLHEELCDVLGSRNCYFSPPTSFLMKYPCIRYSYEGDYPNYADDKEYVNLRRYTLLVISEDLEIWDTIEKLKNHFQYCKVDRSYIADNLNHIALTLYY